MSDKCHALFKKLSQSATPSTLSGTFFTDTAVSNKKSAARHSLSNANCNSCLVRADAENHNGYRENHDAQVFGDALFAQILQIVVDFASNII